MTKSRALNCLLCGILGGLAVAAIVTACSDKDKDTSPVIELPYEQCLVIIQGGYYLLPCDTPLVPVRPFSMPATTTTTTPPATEGTTFGYLDYPTTTTLLTRAYAPPPEVATA